MIPKNNMLSNVRHGRPRSSRGFLLLEILISISILTLVSFGMFVLYDQARERAQYQEVAEQLSDISKNVHVFFADGNYAKFNNATLIANNLVPSSMILGNTIRHSYGGTISSGIRSFPANFGANNFMFLNFDQISKSEDCVDLVNIMDPVAMHIEVFVNGALMGSPKNIGSKIDKANLGAWCAMPSGAQATVRITFPR